MSFSDHGKKTNYREFISDGVVLDLCLVGFLGSVSRDHYKRGPCTLKISAISRVCCFVSLFACSLPASWPNCIAFS